MGTIGADVIAFGFYYLYRPFSVKFRRKLDLSELSSTGQGWIIAICIGLAARSIVFFLGGWFVIEAAYMARASQVRGQDVALETLALMSYGLYMVVQARYRNLESDM